VLEGGLIEGSIDQVNIFPESSSNLDLIQYAIDHVADGIYWSDAQARILDVNNGACKMVGYSREELASMMVAQLDPNYPIEKWPAHWDFLKKQGSATFESVHRHKDGRLINVEITANLMVYNGRELNCAFVRDITERKRIQSETIALMQRNQSLMKTTLDGIHVMDMQGNIVEANDAFCQMLGYTQQEVLSLNVADFNMQYSAEQLRERFKTFIGKSARFETVHRHKDGTPIAVEISTTSAVVDGQPYFVASSRDITARKRDQRMMEMMKFSMDHMGDKVTWVTSDAKVVYANIAACSSLGYTMEEMLKLSVPDFDPDFSAEDWPIHWEELKKLGSFTFESRHRTKSGEIYPVEVSINYMRFGDEEYNCGYVRDITKRKQMEEELQLSSMVFHNSSEGMLVTDENNQIISINPAFSNITGYSFEEVKGKNPRMFKSDRHDQAFYRAMWHEIITTGQWQGEIWDKRKNGEIHAKWLTINTIRNKDGSIHRYVALFSDITEKKKSEELIWRQANFDTLTGLPNRDMFHDRLGQEVKKSIRAELPLALLLVDLDQFKEVNDTLGHAVGDMLLKDVARRISACVRESDTVARLGGDEFTIAISGISDNAHVEDVAQKIISKLAEPFHLGSEVVYISASIGITLYPNDATDIDVLMKNVDQAMYVAKNKGRNRFSYFTASLQEAAQRRLRLTNDLRGALEAGQFSIHFQPIVALSTGRIHKAEALIRWQHSERGMVSPAEFIPLAEETGLIHEIGDWVFKESARWAKHWRNQFAPDFQVSVNKSPVQFRTENHHLASRWSEFLRELGLPGGNIVIEITEGLLLNAEADVTDELLRLRDADIQVAIDDFGTGYSSLSYLKKFDIDYLKIDRSFVNNLETDANDMALSEAIIVMAHKLGLKVIAEGVETEGQRNLLTIAGCDYAQGYLFSKPVPPEEFERLLISQGQ
jgi:diguanylate cyclase (GGDEF)-like protein/PAS domain S-box-containing protein